ncbi:MAG: NfeD family protein [Candidatus Omnitrophota bacterium]
MPIWLSILLLIAVGVIFLLLEVFIIPGFGFAGVIGTVCLGIAIYLSFTTLSLWPAIGVTAGSIMLVILTVKIFQKSSSWQEMRLKKTLKKEDGFQSVDKNLNYLLGKTGKTLASLHPTGVASIAGEKIDVITEGEFIDKDQLIEVIRVEGSKVSVREVT